jgi:hypothetical protein
MSGLSPNQMPLTGQQIAQRLTAAGFTPEQSGVLEAVLISQSRLITALLELGIELPPDLVELVDLDHLTAGA